MYDFAQHTYNGEAVAYASLPNYLLDLIDADTSLTPTAKLIYFRLLRYAAYKKSATFVITIAWLSERLNLNRKTVAAGLSLLKSNGYLTDEGIVIPAPTTISTGARRVPCVPSQSALKASGAEVEESKVKVTSSSNNSVDVDFLQGLLTFVGSTKKLKTPITPVDQDNQRPELTTPDVPILPIADHATGKKVAADVQNLPAICPENGQPIITIQNNTQENNNQRHSAGMFSKSASSRSVDSNQPSVTIQHRKSRVAQSEGQLLGTAQANSLPYKTQAYIESALLRMRAGTADRERYLDEISYSMTKGVFAGNSNQLKSVRACLNLIERGQWKPPAGMY